MWSRPRRWLWNFNAAGTTCLHINVLDAHAAPADDFQLRASGQQSGIHFRVGAHHHSDGMRQRGPEAYQGVIDSYFRQLGRDIPQ